MTFWQLYLITSLEYFGSSEHKILQRNKSFIEILSYEVPAVDEK